MAKNTKGKRPQRSSVASANPRSYSELLKQEKQSGITPATPEQVKPSTEDPAPTTSSKAVDWRGEYSQEFSDLRQMLWISAVLIALMIVLGLVI